MGEGTTKKTPLASSPTPIRLPPPSPPSIPYSFPAAYLSTRHKHICKSIREHGGEGEAARTHAPPNSGSARHVLKGSAESWRGCHNSGRESSVMPAARLVQMASATRDPRVILWGNSSRCLSYVTAQQGEAEAGGTRRGAHVRGICAFIKCGCVHSVWFIWVRIH